MVHAYDHTISRPDSFFDAYERLRAAVVQQSFEDMIALIDIRDGKRTRLPVTYERPSAKKVQKWMAEITRFWSNGMRGMGFELDVKTVFDAYVRQKHIMTKHGMLTNQGIRKERRFS